MSADLEPYQGGTTLALRAGHLDYPTILKLGEAFAASGLFSDVKDAGTAAVKIMAGAEMGLEPVAAMNGIDIIPGRQGRGPRMRPNADVQAWLAARAGYAYRAIEHTAEKCVLEWTHDGKVIGTSEFSVAQARKAGLVRDGGAWNAWPEPMTLARAVTLGVKLYCRHVLAGQIGGMAVVTTEELEQEYPDPRDDLVKALHATYREVFSRDPDEDEESYRIRRLDWSGMVLGRHIDTWNGPQAPESLTRAEFQTLLDRATTEAVTVLHNRLHWAFGDDEVAWFNFLHQALPEVPFDALSDLDSKQRKAVHKALDALQAAPGSGPAAPTPPTPTVASGADHTHTSAGDDPEGAEASRKAESPAEHHTDEVHGEVAPADGTVPGGSPVSLRLSPSGTVSTKSAPIRKHHKTNPTGAPGVAKAVQQAQQARDERKAQPPIGREPTDPIHFIPSPTFRQFYVTWFENQAGGDWGKGMEDARRHAQAHLDRLRSEGQMGDQFTRPQLEAMAAETFESKP